MQWCAKWVDSPFLQSLSLGRSSTYSEGLQNWIRCQPLSSSVRQTQSFIRHLSSSPSMRFLSDCLRTLACLVALPRRFHIGCCPCLSGRSRDWTAEAVKEKTKPNQRAMNVWLYLYDLTLVVVKSIIKLSCARPRRPAYFRLGPEWLLRFYPRACHPIPFIPRNSLLSFRHPASHLLSPRIPPSSTFFFCPKVETRSWFRTLNTSDIFHVNTIPIARTIQKSPLPDTQTFL